MVLTVEQIIFVTMAKQKMNRHTTTMRFDPRVLRRFNFVLDIRGPRGA